MNNSKTSGLRSLIFGGLVPVIGYTVIEEFFGTTWGLIAGIGFSLFEIIFEFKTSKKVDFITWVGTTLVILLGLIALFTNEGVWFRLQPAIMEFLIGMILLISFIIKKPFLLIIAQKQNMFSRMNPVLMELIKNAFSHLTFRLSLFFMIHFILASWAAFSWSTRMWALLKGVGFTVSLIAYLLIEMLILRKKIKKILFSYERFKRTI